MSDRPQWTSEYPVPPARRFRAYAFDPLASASAETSVVNEVVISLPWEDPWEEQLGLGPSGEYLEVIDHDPAVGVFYRPLDPNDVLLVAQDGLPPSEGVPQFHQQMTYAVAMKTIRNFERALGRKVLWSDAPGDGFVQKLRIYPHALREANAYYSPEKKALLFGYYRGSPSVRGHSLPNAWVFTCLSHDIIAHETAHAILDGVHRRFVEPSSLDTLAFHEAFADIVALMQHFTMTEVVEHQLAQTRGVLRGRNLLTTLAGQFGDSTGRDGGLRQAIDATAGAAPPVLTPDVTAPHERGSYLVAAVFDALVTIFERRSADLVRLVTGRSSFTGEELPPDLVKRLAVEAAKSADHLLRICVRALDYVPPVDISFGDFLRAMITADADLVSDDRFRYRQAVAEGFRRRGIYPRDAMSMVPESLVWQAPGVWDAELATLDFNDLVPDLDRSVKMTRAEIWKQSRANAMAVHRWLTHDDDRTANWERMLGLRLRPDAPATIGRSRDGLPKVEVHSVRLARRLGPDGQEQEQWVIEVTQRRRAFFDSDQQAAADAGEGDPQARDFWFRGGATLLVSHQSGEIRYAIRKRIDDDRRLAAHRTFLLGGREADMGDVYFGEHVREPFALLHRS
ncbi:MAG TPA: hypothetical protein VEA15_10565 [Caulobacteraceae bacterium]|nr:hypothetical protein [Caulobacteraceae bacterium]